MATCAHLLEKKRRKMELSIVKGQKVNYPGKLTAFFIADTLKKKYMNACFHASSHYLGLSDRSLLSLL
jgi:hypothetical protein